VSRVGEAWVNLRAKDRQKGFEIDTRHELQGITSRETLDRLQPINVTYSHDYSRTLIQSPLRTSIPIHALSRAFPLCTACQGTAVEHLHHRTTDAQVPEWRSSVRTGSTTATRPGRRAVRFLGVYRLRPHCVTGLVGVGGLL